MTAKTNNQRQTTLKAKRKAEGLVRLELWVKPEHKDQIKLYAQMLTIPELNSVRITSIQL
jgi:hypothetical protein